jgi:Tfp pilus assembly protein PilV
MHTRGSSLVESLVAMSVFAIGSAATGAWFAQVLVTDMRASRLLAAEAIASNLKARMRANEEGVSAGGYTASWEALACARGCSALALAGDDMRRFHEAVARQLGPRAYGDAHCDARGHCLISIDWDGREWLAWRLKP